MIVLDTSALIYWTLDQDRLSEAAWNTIEGAEQIVVSSISVWEIALKVKRSKLQIPLPVAEYADWLQRIEILEILPVDVQTWLDNIDLKWEHRDPADRTIVAVATRLSCYLISSDRVMADFYPKTVW
jgi:PIN domain nuclease of toxin-antitoxin system